MKIHVLKDIKKKTVGNVPNQIFKDKNINQHNI